MREIHSDVRDAAKLCRLVQDKYLVAATKTDGAQSEPVTIADYGSQAIICRALQMRYPDDAVVSEESGAQFAQLVSKEQRAQVLDLLAAVLRQPVSEDELLAWLDFGVGRSAARTWVIDPIDGTKGFLAQRHYAIACGLLVDGRLQAGIVAAPGYANGAGALFYTRAGEAWRAPLSAGGGVKVKVSERRDVSEFVAVQSFERGACQQVPAWDARANTPAWAMRESSRWIAWRSTPWSPVAMRICTCACRGRAAATRTRSGIMRPEWRWCGRPAASQPTWTAGLLTSHRARRCPTPA